jgi:predicted LPLAT superfamily acyltransferase
MAESGSLAWLRILRAFYRTFGRRASALLRPIVVYFFLTGRISRPASLDYLRTLWATPRGRAALGEPPTHRHVFRHLHAFAENLLDRMIMWSGEEASFEIEARGRELIDALVREGRGGILLSSHIGSFDMLRALSKQHGIVLNVLMFTRHAARINSFFERLQAGRNLRLIRFEPGTLDAAFEMRAAIARGEFIGILGDRVWPSEHDRTAEVPFLGRPARFRSTDPAPGRARLRCLHILHPHRSDATPPRLAFRAEGGPRAEREKHAEQLVQKFGEFWRTAASRRPTSGSTSSSSGAMAPAIEPAPSRLRSRSSPRCSPAARRGSLRRQ